MLEGVDPMEDQVGICKRSDLVRQASGMDGSLVVAGKSTALYRRADIPNHPIPK